MYFGSDPRHVLNELTRGREALSEEARRESEAKRASRAFRGWRPRAFRFWRLHVMVWVEDGSGVS
jgi:hypothetical protein